MSSELWMRRAIRLARQGEGWTNPNPMVGAVIVKDGVIIGEGCHAKWGEAHAERNALAACDGDPAGATVYVTLEPCCHHGKTPPCTEALLEAGVKKVVIGSRDPNPKVSGKGAELLRQNGVEVQEDFLRAECDALNPIFFHYMATGRPYVSAKYAMTADGKIATKTGASQWITGDAAREHAHMLRNRHRAIMVGIGTVLQDDPMLNCRIPGGRNPLRVVCDRRLQLPSHSKLCLTAKRIPTIVAAHDPSPLKSAALESAGISVWNLPLLDGRLDLGALLERLGKEEVDSVLVEGGSRLHGSILEQGLAQKLYCYVSPKLFGGTEAKSPVGGAGVEQPNQAIRLSEPEVRAFPGGDILLEYQVKER